MQIAKMFASLGFNIDLGDLNAFEAKIRATRTEMANFARFANRSSAAVRKLAKDMGALDNALDAKKITAARQRMDVAFKSYVKNVDKSSDVLMRFSAQARTSMFDINRLADVTMKGDYAWLQYADSVAKASVQLAQVKSQISGLRTAAPVGALGAGSGGARNGAGRPNTGNNRQRSAAEDAGLLAGARSFLQPLTPTGIVGGGALGAGYLLKMLVDAGREFQSMELKIKSVSRTTAEFNDNLKFIKETSKTLALDVKDVGDAYASIFISARDTHSAASIQKMFTGFSKFFKAMQLSPEAIKGSFLAIQQMFNKQKIQAEEFTGQLGERATGVTQLMAKTLGVTTAQLFKMMQDGKLTTDMLFKLAGAMDKAADAGGGLGDALRTSASAQMRLSNAWKEFSARVMKAGLDVALYNVLSALSGILETLAPLIEQTIKFINGLTELVKFLWQAVSANKALTAELVFLIGFLAVVRTPMLLYLGLIRGITGAMWLATAAARAFSLALKATIIGVIVLLLSELMDYINGTVNWVTVLQLSLEVLAASFVQIGLIIENWALSAEVAIGRVIDRISLLKLPDMPEWMKTSLTVAMTTVSPATGAIMAATNMRPSDAGQANVKQSPIDVNLNIKQPDGSVTRVTTSAGGAATDIAIQRLSQGAANR